MQLNYDLNETIRIPNVNCDNLDQNVALYRNEMAYRDLAKRFSGYRTSLGLFGAELNKVLNDAANGDTHATFLLGKRYFSIPFKKKTAFKYFENAANNGDDEAQAALGYCYLMGIGVRKNIEKAIEALSASTEGLWVLEMAYILGKGVRRDFNKAYISFMKSVEISRGKPKDSGIITQFLVFLDSGDCKRVGDLQIKIITHN